MEMARGSKVITVSLTEPEAIKTLDGFTVTPDSRLEDIPIHKIGCLVITGGHPDTLVNHQKWGTLKRLIHELEKIGKIVAGICGEYSR